MTFQLKGSPRNPDNPHYPDLISFPFSLLFFPPHFVAVLDNHLSVFGNSDAPPSGQRTGLFKTGKNEQHESSENHCSVDMINQFLGYFHT